MESRSYRGVVYDDHFRCNAVCLFRFAGMKTAAARSGAHPISIYRWDREFYAMPLGMQVSIGKALFDGGWNGRH